MKEELAQNKQYLLQNEQQSDVPVSFFSPSKGTGRKTGGGTERMPKMVATGTRIGIRPSLFSSGCL